VTAQERADTARANGNEVEARYWQRIADLVAAAPPFTRAQEDRLRILLRPDPEPQAGPKAA